MAIFKKRNKNNSSLSEKEEAFRATDEDLMAEQHRSSSKDVQRTTSDTNDGALTLPTQSHAYHFVPLRMGGNGRTHKPTAGSSALIDEIGGLPTLESMTDAFYTKAFQDVTLDKFIRSHEDPHASRFARWIHQKLTNSTVWDEDREARSHAPVEVANRQTVVVSDRSSAHVAAWYSAKRPQNEVGRHFKLDECRTWMRLHFWAMRETIGDTSPAFTDFYVRFIGHFVSVYEGSAPAFARDSYRWSEKHDNIQEYINNGRKMKDVLGLSLGQALKQIPEDEANDTVWPYNG